MSEETIKIGTVLSVDDAKRSINDLRTSIERSRSALKGLNEGTKEYNDTLNKLLDDQATLAKIINELPTTTKTVTDRFDQMQKSVKGMTSGFQALQGIMQLTNTENQNVINGLHKMMAVQQVVQGLNGFISAIRGSTVAMRIFNMVVKSNPLMLLISAVAAAIGIFSIFRDEISDTASDLDELNNKEITIDIKSNVKTTAKEAEDSAIITKNQIPDIIKGYINQEDLEGINNELENEQLRHIREMDNINRSGIEGIQKSIDRHTKLLKSQGATESEIYEFRMDTLKEFYEEKGDSVLAEMKNNYKNNQTEIRLLKEDIQKRTSIYEELQKNVEIYNERVARGQKDITEAERERAEESKKLMAQTYKDLVISQGYLDAREKESEALGKSLKSFREGLVKYNQFGIAALEQLLEYDNILTQEQIKSNEDYLKYKKEYAKEQEKLLNEINKTNEQARLEDLANEKIREEQRLETNLQRIEYFNNIKLEKEEEYQAKLKELNKISEANIQDKESGNLKNEDLKAELELTKEAIQLKRDLVDAEYKLTEVEQQTAEERKHLHQERINIQNQYEEQLAYIKEGQEEQRAKEDEQKLKDMEDHRNSLDRLLDETLAKLEMKDLEIEKERELLEVYTDLTNQRINIDNKYAQTKQKLEQKKQAIEQSGLRSTSTILKSAGSLLSEHTAGYKALAIASTTIDTYAAAQAAYKYMTPIGGPIAGGLAAAAAVASGIQNVMAIKSTEVKGASSSNDGGSVNVPLTIEPIDVQENFTKLDSDDLDIINNTNQRVYVVESDITETQNRVKVNEAEATF